MKPDALRFGAPLLLVLAAAVAPRPGARFPPADTVIPEAGRVCVAREGPGWRAGACPLETDAQWYADDADRRAWGLPLCWWTASDEDFEGLDGVGPALASRLTAFRDTGGTPGRVEEVSGVGPTLAATLRPGVTLACPHVRSPTMRAANPAAQ